MNSIWSAGTAGQSRSCPTLESDIKTDVLIIGGGMAGILLAHRLTMAEVPNVVAEAKTVGSGVTKNTTAKITAQHGLIYADLIRRLGIEQARLHYDANTRAIQSFRQLSAEHPCDFEEMPAYVFSVNNRRKLEREAEAYQKLGIPGNFMEEISLPIRTAGAVMMEKQAQFHPLKLLLSLLGKLNIYENTKICKINGNTAFTDNHKITTKHIVLATHFPMVNIPGLYFLKLYQHRSYVIALEGASLPDGVYVDEQEKGFSFRKYKNLLFIGGGDHRTGKRGGQFEELRALAKTACPQAIERFQWATQDCMTLDGIPYIGRHRANKTSLYVATGFNKWGMTGSMVASELLYDLIINGKSPLEKLYSPQRSMMTWQLAANGAAAVAGLCTPGGPRCSHMGCKLHKNKTENSWDCTCHGSRYHADGKLIDNPAKKDISP